MGSVEPFLFHPDLSCELLPLLNSPLSFQAVVAHVGPEEGDVTPETTSTSLEEVRSVNWARTRTLGVLALDINFSKRSEDTSVLYDLRHSSFCKSEQKTC